MPYQRPSRLFQANRRSARSACALKSSKESASSGESVLGSKLLRIAAALACCNFWFATAASSLTSFQRP